MPVRPARESDVPAICRVARRAWSAAHEPIVGPEAVDSFLAEYYTPERFRSRIDDPETMVYVSVPASESVPSGDRAVDAGPDGDTASDADGEGDATGGDAASATAGSPAPVGYAVVTADDADSVYHLGQLYVHPDRWGEGIGGRLLDRVERAVRERGGDRIELGVLAENDRAVGFYEAAGFERTGERYDDRLDARAYEYERRLESN